MEFMAETILQFMLVVTWTCLNTTPVNQKHVYFTKFLTSQESLEDIASKVSLVFAPGLLDLLRAATPPTIQYFKTLPSDPGKSWAVYLLVLEKHGCRSKIYIGSSTNTVSGVRHRFGQYRRLETLPHYVKKAVDEGYTIVHKGCSAGFLSQLVLYNLWSASCSLLWKPHSLTCCGQ
jgi:hypothetical protein